VIVLLTKHQTTSTASSFSSYNCLHDTYAMRGVDGEN